MSDDIEQIRHAMWENYRAPNGTARNARAEELVSRAEATGDTGLLLETLSQLITAYEYSAERSKMFVPFARLLRMWDEDPGVFDGQAAHELFWRFKWVTGSMIDYPEIPLASIEQWLGEMERRYRLAGYNARTVRAEEFFVAWHVGDLPRAGAAYTEWLAGDRDPMSNCHACEAAGMGRWEAHQGRDELALDRWSEVLAGRLTCAEEPHRVLAYALLPLLRLGRPDEARTNHLRGYRMARGNESLLPSIGRHIEFCALTGNEARGLEILAEHAGHLAPVGNPDSRLSLLEAAVLLLARLEALGLGDRDTPGPLGRTWTVASLLQHCEELRADTVAQFDRRNGTDAVSRESAQRIAQQPLLERLPLGLNTVLPGTAATARAATAPAPAVPANASFEELLAEARRLRDRGHPSTGRAWSAVEAALGEREPDDLLRAELATQRGMRFGGEEPGTALQHFEAATAAYGAAERPGDAAVAAGRAAVAVALTGADGCAAEALRRADAAVAEARAAVAAARATERQLAVAMLCRAKVHIVQALQLGDAAASARGQEALAETLELATAALAPATGAGGAAETAAGVGDEQAEADRAGAGSATPEGAGPDEAGRLFGVIADVHHSRAGLYQQTPRLMLPELRAAADAHLRAERPWHAADPLIQLARAHAQFGELEAAETVAEEALRHGAGLLAAADAGRTELLLADLLGHRGEHEDAVRHALEATRWLDQAGLGAEEGAAARHRLAVSYQALDRHAEAAEMLQAALPDLVAQGERAELTVRRSLGESLSELREHAEAAEQFALAAQIVDGWDEPHLSAQLASSTAESLSAAGRSEPAEAAYLRAQELWGKAGVPAMVVRTLRARAWMTFRQGRDAGPGRALMLQAERTAGEALAAPGQAPEDVDGLRREYADTWRQLAALLRDVAEDQGWNDVAIPEAVQAALYQEAWDAYRTAAEAFADCAGPGPALSAQARLDAARIRIETGRNELAAGELEQVRTLAEAGGEPLAQVGQRAGALLEWLEKQAAG